MSLSSSMTSDLKNVENFRLTFPDAASGFLLLVNASGSKIMDRKKLSEELMLYQEVVLLLEAPMNQFGGFDRLDLLGKRNW